MRTLWVVEILDGDKKVYPKGAKWTAWENQAYETRDKARQALESHSKACWTRGRIVKYTPEKQ